MKYPQLVSTRAVNAISDWLVSRLEQLGVEAPLIYSRLLLSLLQSSVQVNDPIEFNNLETFLASRKGNSKRYPPCDTDTLRKITAVQCLMDIVSSEQEITKIENLVDELCEKVNDIEKQSTNLEEDDELQIATSALNSVLTTSSSSFKKTNEKLSTTASSTSEGGVEGSTTAKLSNVTALSVSRKGKEIIASDGEDPRKRYYRAFPALSKEMEDSIGLLRRNTKSLTWPVDRKINSSNKSVVNSTTTVATTVNVSSTSSGNEKANISSGVRDSSALLGNSQTGDSNTVLCNTAGVKRKTKRRRNQAMSKGKTTAGNNIWKNSYGGGSSSPTWDTDFEGSWEMGRDLIKEFIVKQNNRNRSTSESGAYNMATGGNNVGRGAAAHETHEKRMKSMLSGDAKFDSELIAPEQEQEQQQNDAIKINDQVATVAEPCKVEIPFFGDENSKSEDTLASVSEITEGSLSTARRLYERDISSESNEQSMYDYQRSLLTSSSEQLDFAQFKAKFNSNVEALWKTTNSSVSDDIGKVNKSNTETDSAVSGAAFKDENLESFWSNYYSHHYDVEKFKKLHFSDFCDYSLTSGVSAFGSNSHSNAQSDYFSMPTISTTGEGGGVGGRADDFDKSVGGKRAGGKSSPIGVFLQNTIWSDNSNASYPDTDESFFMKVLNSTSSNQKPQDQLKMDIGSDKSSFYYPYQVSKWSEGINGVPHGKNIAAVQHHHYQQQQQPLVITSSSSSSSISTMDQSARSRYTNDFVESTPSSSSSYLGGNLNWQIPAGDNLQADVKSWNSSNPTSLTELYGGKKTSSNFDRNNETTGIAVSSTSSSSSTITLANHSATGSGFIAYSRVKSYLKLIESKPKAKWHKPDVEYHHLSTSAASDDENLLTSERTHFHPIKMSYADGHTFEISNNLDPVDFERSESGYLYLESEKYLEYTRSDILAEDENSVMSHYHRTASMNRDCGASSVESTKSSQSEFIIRFRLKTTDKACQTDSNGIGPSVLSSSLVYQLASSHLPRQQAAQNSPKDDVDDDDEDDWMDIGCGGGGGVLSAGNPKDDECCSMDQWSMVEIGKKCVDNNNSTHTLWGMCPACNNDMKSIPANRLLKAELNMDGDEIMSDLRFMQDLYIGSDWEDQNGTREDGGGGGDDDDTDLDAETIRDCEFYQAMATPAGCGELDEEYQQQDILYNVNKLIADLLRPENAQSLANALGAVGSGYASGVGCFGVVGSAAAGGSCITKIGAQNDNSDAAGNDEKGKDEKYIGGLWNSEENIIWKKELNPIGLFSRLNNNNNDSFLEKLNWEYSNLAEIWGKASPDKLGLSTEKICSAAEKEDDDDEDHDQASVDVNCNEENNIKIACKNMKNLLKSTNISSPNGNSAIFEINERRINDCKRMQCFLNSNKVKISNRSDRKRRHSASQNVCSNNNNNNNNNSISTTNNNNNNMYDNNNLKLSLFGSASYPPSTTTIISTITTTAPTKATTKDTHSDYGRIILSNYDNDEHQEHEYIQHYNDDQQQENNKNSQATIITCKYWTTMQPIISGSVIDEGQLSDDHSIDAHDATASFFIDKNSQFIDGLPSITLNTSSILKHVTLVSRPLTR